MSIMAPKALRIIMIAVTVLPIVTIMAVVAIVQMRKLAM